MVTGEFKHTLDHDVPGAMPVVVRRPPTINGSVRSVDTDRIANVCRCGTYFRIRQAIRSAAAKMP